MGATQEQNLIDKCRNGDSSSFGPLIQLYRRRLYSYLYKICGEKEQAEDLFQETLIKIWRGIGKYSEHQKFSSWLFAIAHNTAMDSLRMRKKNEPASGIDPDETKSSNDPYKELVNSETRAMIDKAIERLPEKQKNVFLLRVYGEVSFKEISELTNEPINTVLSHMHYSVKKLKNMIGKKND